MDLHDMALIAAGAIGSGVAVIHGVLTQRFITRPLVRLAGKERLPGSIVRMVPALLHFSTLVWLLGGLALVAAALWFEPGAKLATVAFVGVCYLFGTLGNLWATRGRHPGWMLLGAAVVLIVFGASTLTSS